MTFSVFFFLVCISTIKLRNHAHTFSIPNFLKFLEYFNLKNNCHSHLLSFWKFSLLYRAKSIIVVEIVKSNIYEHTPSFPTVSRSFYHKYVHFERPLNRVYNNLDYWSWVLYPGGLPLSPKFRKTVIFSNILGRPY